MNDLLTLATEPSVHYDCNFHFIELPNQQEHHFELQDFVIEANTKTIDSKIALFLGISHEWCEKYIGGNNRFTHCQYPREGFHGHYMRYLGITLDQLQILWNEAQNNRADKYKPILSELILTKILPLFNQIKQIAPKKEIDLNLSTTNQPLTMSSQEMADLTGVRHDNVMRTIEGLLEKGLLRFTQIEEIEQINNLGYKRKVKCYKSDKRDSLVIVARLSPDFTAKVVDRWQELEEGLQSGKNNIQLAIPQSLPEALRLAATLAEEKDQLLHERDEAIRTKSQISTRREASAMGTVGALAKKVKELEAKISRSNLNYEYATVLAIQSRLKSMKVSGLKLTYYCNAMGLVMKDVPDDRWGAVHSYPAQAWKDVYQIDINTILNREV